MLARRCDDDDGGCCGSTCITLAAASRAHTNARSAARASSVASSSSSSLQVARRRRRLRSAPFNLLGEPLFSLLLFLVFMSISCRLLLPVQSLSSPLSSQRRRRHLQAAATTTTSHSNNAVARIGNENFNNATTTVLVTGGLGFVGSHVVQQLLLSSKQQYRVIICDDQSQDGARSNLEWLVREMEMLQSSNNTTATTEVDDVVVTVDDLLSNDDEDKEKNRQQRLVVYTLDLAEHFYRRNDNKNKNINDDRVDLLQLMLERERPQAILHLAARAGTRASIPHPLSYVRVNVGGTLHLLEIARQVVPHAPFILTSSSSVYGKTKNSSGKNQQQPTHNNTAQNSTSSSWPEEVTVTETPIAPYAATKLAAELLAHVYFHLYQTDVTILRLFTVYGPRVRNDMAPYRFIDCIFRGISIPMYTGGGGGGETTNDDNQGAVTITSSRDYTYVTDIAAGIIQAMERKLRVQHHVNATSSRSTEAKETHKPSFDIINLGQGQGTTLTEFISEIERHTGKQKAKVQVWPRQPGDMDITLADITRAQHELQYRPTTKLSDGIPLTVQWYLDNNNNDKKTGTAVDEQPSSRLLEAAGSSNKNDKRRSSNNDGGRDGDDDDDWRTIPIVPPHTQHKTVLVTGAAGFIGSHVAQALLKRGDRVIVLDQVNDYYSVRVKEDNLRLLLNSQGGANVTIYRGDVANATLLDIIFTKEQPEWICHLAARAGVRPSIQDPYVYVHSNIRATTQLLEMSRRYRVRNFVLASSSSVYGGLRESVFTEDLASVHRPISPYAATKKACELLGYVYHHLYDLPVTALRFFTVYGPRGRPDMAPYKFVDRIARGVPVQQFGDGSSSRDYTYIDDIRDGVIRALDRPYAYQVLNLGKGDRGTRLSEFLQLVPELLQKEAKIEQWPDQPGDVPYTRANISKAQRLLGYQPKVSFRQGMEQLVGWYREQQQQLGTKNHTASVGRPSTASTELPKRKSGNSDKMPRSSVETVDTDADLSSSTNIGDDDVLAGAKAPPLPPVAVTSIPAATVTTDAENQFYQNQQHDLIAKEQHQWTIFNNIQWLLMVALLLCRVLLTSKCNSSNSAGSYRSSNNHGMAPRAFFPPGASTP